MDNKIKIRGARQHNLKEVNLDVPKNSLVVFTGVSGSGKSSLAFDTIYAEGQRRYVESLSTYARQFLGVMEKPDVDTIEGLSPAISIDQKTTSKNPRSTVGTITEVYDYLRLLFARIGHPHCPICGREITSQTVDQIVDSSIKLMKENLKNEKVSKFFILSPIVTDKKGEFTSLFANLKAKGFTQVRVDGHIRNLNEEFVLIKTNKHTIEVVVDRISISKNIFEDVVAADSFKKRINDSVEMSLNMSDGLVVISKIKDSSLDIPTKPKDFEDHLYSEKFACPFDNIQLPEIEPRSFSFNSPHGACDECAGIGRIQKVEPELIFSEELSITEGGILPFANLFEHDTWYARLLKTVAEENGIDPREPLKKLTKEDIEIILNGTGNKTYKVEGTNRQGKMTQIYEEFPGVIAELEKRHANTDSDHVRSSIEKYMREKECPKCLGTRLNEQALSITVNKLSIADVSAMPIDESLMWVTTLLKESGESKNREAQIGKLILKEIKIRLEFLKSVGLQYLTIDRSSSTLSGGEAQRIRLASQIGSGLTGVLYVLDEPTIGLHQRDNQRLIDTLKKLRDLGNSVVVVEHDEEMINQADHIVDFGPNAGKFGGAVIAQGNPDEIKRDSNSITGKYLSGAKKINIKGLEKNGVKEKKIALYGCKQYNLKDVDVEFPLGRLVVITGVSGSGKSSLLVDTLYPALMRHFNPYYNGEVGEHRKITGMEDVDKVILIDQSPIGRTPRSNPATYTKLFDYVRDVFAETRDAKASGFKKGRFSFNVKGGRCEACEGQGQIKIEMQFMSDIWVECEVCQGKRYNSQTLEILYKGKNIAEVLDMTIQDAKEFFHAHPPIAKRLETLEQVGLGYMELGQPATTLSGGEAQRVKLSSELAKRDTGNTVYILDEPTTGLHFADLEKLMNVLRELVNRGNSVLLIEHNMDVIKNADWIIDIGPEGGADGGKVIAQGTINDIMKSDESYTAQYLKKILS